MFFRTLKIGAAVAATVVAFGGAPTLAQSCAPTSQQSEPQSCVARSANPTYSNNFGNSRDDWCAASTTGKAQKDYWYVPGGGGQMKYGYTVFFDCTACAGVIIGSLDMAKYRAICP